MNDDADIDGLAAEYVVGSLSHAERQAVDARRAREAALDQAINAWEARLGSLADLHAPDTKPPAFIWESLLRRITDERVNANRSAEMRGRRQDYRLWQILAWSGGTATACLALFLIWLLHSTLSTPGTMLVAVLQKTSGTTTADEAGPLGPPGFVVTIDLRAREIMVLPVAPQSAPGKRYHLWIVRGRLEKPISLGVIAHSEKTTLPIPRGDADISMNATVVISLEPEGRPPTEAPTGPIVFAGAVVRTSQ